MGRGLPLLIAGSQGCGATCPGVLATTEEGVDTAGVGPKRVPAEPAFARRSASSFPGNPECPGIHMSVTELQRARVLSCAIQSRTVEELVVVRPRAFRAAWLSEWRKISFPQIWLATSSAAQLLIASISFWKTVELVPVCWECVYRVLPPIMMQTLTY